MNVSDETAVDTDELRFEADKFEAAVSDGHPGDPSLLRDAADELERLRRIVDRVGDLVAGCTIADGPCCPDCNAWEDEDQVTAHTDECALAAALSFFYAARRRHPLPVNSEAPPA